MLNRVSEATAISYWRHGDGSRDGVRLMLIDRDGERRLDDPIHVNFNGWRRIVFSSKAVQRDPFDGIKDGDGRPNPDQVAGLAFAVVASGENASTIIIDAITAHQ